MAFTMQVANPEEIKQEIALQVTPSTSELSILKEQADQNAEALMSINLDSLPDKRNYVSSIESFGSEAMQTSAKKNSLLAVTVGKLAQDGSEGGQVSKSLLDLQREIKDLDPGLVDFTKTGLLGAVFNPIRAYFHKYEKAESVIADIVASLNRGRGILVNDNTTLEIEESGLRELSKKIQKEIELGSLMDDSLSARLAKAQDGDADLDKIKFIQEEILFPLRQKVMDLQQMIIVNHQGIIAMEIIRRNNKELIRGVDRANSVTVAALRTAVIVASALYNQRIVLKKIQLLNETTNNMISSTSKMLKEQGAEIQTQSMQTGVSVETLKESYKDLIESLEAISTYKQQALPVMKQTIDLFREMAAEGETQIQKLERGSAMN